LEARVHREDPRGRPVRHRQAHAGVGAAGAVEQRDVSGARLRLVERWQGHLRQGPGKARVALRKVVSLLLLGLVFGAAATAAPNPAPDLEKLANEPGAPATQKPALDQLAELDDPAVEVLVRAIKDGALYRLGARLVTLGDDGGLRDARGNPVTDDKGQPASLPDGSTPIPLGEELFGVVQRILERFEIFGKDPATRRATAIKLGNSKN